MEKCIPQNQKAKVFRLTNICIIKNGEFMDKKLENSNKNIDKKSSIDSMNEDLKQWLTKEDKQNLDKKIETHKKLKKPRGMCKICGKNKANEVCIKCNKSVCNTCYFNIIGLCENCLTKETVEKWKNKRPDWEKVLGVDWVG